MKITVDNNYGSDADGNRGSRVEFAELESSDYDDVRDILFEMWGDEDEWPSTCFITFEGYEHEVSCGDYK